MMKHANVSKTDKFYPLIGDTAIVLKNRSENKYYFWDHIEEAVSGKNYDIKFGSRGSDTRYYMLSPQAFKQFAEHVPHSIDRSPLFNRFFGRVSPESIGSLRATEAWKKRRSAATSTIGLNYASRYIPKMIESMTSLIDKWKEGEWMNLNKEISDMTFDIICSILFGMDINDKIETCNHLSLDGTITQMKFAEFFPRIIEDIMQSVQLPLGLMFPFLIDYDLIEPFKTIQKNADECRRVVNNFLETSSDKQSVFRKLVDEHGISEDEALQDIIALLFAGHDTTSHGIVSALYFLKKNPEVYQKLISELAKLGLSKDSDFGSNDTKHLIHN